MAGLMRIKLDSHNVGGQKRGQLIGVLNLHAVSLVKFLGQFTFA